MSPIQIRQFLSENLLTLSASVVIFMAIVLHTLMLYGRSADVMQSQLSRQLRTAAALGAQQFTGEEIDEIQGIDSLDTELFESMVARLQNIRAATPNIQYAYLMRKTRKHDMLEFVADADSLDGFEASDANGDGIIDPDEQPSLPGDLYDVSDIEAMQGAAFEKPTVDKEITSDQWGDLISGYAPIRRSDGSVAAIIGIDMDAEDYVTLSRQAFSNYAFISMLLIGFIIVLTVVYILWERRINTMKVIQDERSAMLALTTHQLGGPISSIRWWLEVMDDEGLCTKENACGQISTAVEKMNAIIQQLIDVERQEHNKVRYIPEEVLVMDLVNAATEHLPREEREKHPLQVSVDDGMKARLDKKLIASALGELMENAMTYSDDGAEVHVSAQIFGRWLYLSVRDHGMDIPANEHLRIFQKMTRGSNAVRYKPNGNGLGLYVVNLIVNKAGGSLKMVSKEGEGSTFTLRLPIE